MSIQKGQANFSEALDAYLFDLEAAGRSPLTIESYRQALTGLLRFLETQGVQDWAAVNQGHLRQFLAARLRVGLKAGTVRVWATIISCFFNWLIQEGTIQENPMRRVRRPKTPQHPINVFSTAELISLFKEVERTRHPVRNKAILCLFLDCGLRLSELSALKLDNYDTATSTLMVNGKGARVRAVRMGQQCREALENHLQIGQESKEAEAYLQTGRRCRGALETHMASRNANPSRADSLWGVDRAAIKDLIYALGRRIGIHAHPHKFRHTFACRFLDAGGTLDELQYLMGHAHISTTMIYAAAGQQERALKSHVEHSPLDALRGDRAVGGDGTGRGA